MRNVVSVVDISRSERERIRVDFYRAQRAQPGFSSVAVRRGKSTGAWYVDVSVTGPVELPEAFRGLAVRVKAADGAVNAIGRLTQAS
jgi:hypothetical protein